MAVMTRSRAFPNLTMQAGTNDRPQKPVGAGFPGSNLYSNRNIWTSSLSMDRERSAGSKGSSSRRPDGCASLTRPAESDGSPSGSSALNANSDANNVWSSNPWNSDRPVRSVNTSPSRTRDGVLSGGSAYFDHQSSVVCVNKDAYASNPFGDEPNAYAAAFSAQRRSPQDTTAYRDAMAAYSHRRDPSLPPSRQSQGSPAFPADMYRAGHTPSNSMQSKRQLAGHAAAAYSTQTANQRAFDLNNRIDDDFPLQFGRRMALEIPPSASSFNPSSQPFQLNPGSQPWVGDGNSGLRYGSAADSSADSLAAQLAVLRPSPVDRVSPGSSYRQDSDKSSQGYNPASSAWSSRSASRDPRPADYDRRAQAQPYAAGYTALYYPGQFPYAGVPPQCAASFLDPYSQSFRHHPVMAGFGLHAMNAGYPLCASLPTVRSSRDQDSGQGLRSALLDEFRMSRRSNRRYELKDIYGHMVEFSGDQHGSRFIQQKLESANSDEKEQVFREIEPNAIQLMKDVFGNYVVQKFFEHGNQVQKRVLAEKMRGKVVDLSLQVYACRVVQKALEHVLVEQQAEMARELEPEVLRVTRDQNGNHVVQKMIELVPHQYIGFIMDALRGQVTGLASHMYGCRVIQRMLEHGSDAEKLDMMAELHESAQILITDQYGNYVAQHVIENGKAQDRHRMVGLVMTQLLALSKHKFASNVVEKCIEFGTPEQRSAMRASLTSPASDGSSPLQQLMRDQYGNYVIQKMLKQLQGSEREAMAEEVRPQYLLLRRGGSARQLQALERLLGAVGGRVAARTETASPHADGGSAACISLLTNDSNSPEGSGPPSTRLSADGFPSDDVPKKESTQATARATPRVQG